MGGGALGQNFVDVLGCRSTACIELLIIFLLSRGCCRSTGHAWECFVTFVVGYVFRVNFRCWRSALALIQTRVWFGKF